MKTSESTQSNTTNNNSGNVIDLIGDTIIVEKNHITSTSRSENIHTLEK